MIENIQTALDTILKTWADAEPIVVAWENIGRQTDIDVPHVASFLLPAETGVIGLADIAADSYVGIYQVNVYVEKGDGTGSSRPLVDGLLKAFLKGTTVTVDGQITRIETSWRSNAIDNEAWYVIPVSVRYKSFV
jgi:hypothetical protein